MNIQISDPTYPAATRSGKPQMRSLVYFEQAARSLFEPQDFQRRWAKIRDDFDGCTLQIIKGTAATDETEQIRTRWIVRGMADDRAEYYNNRFAIPFENALIGLLGERVSLTFESIQECPDV